MEKELDLFGESVPQESVELKTSEPVNRKEYTSKAVERIKILEEKIQTLTDKLETVLESSNNVSKELLAIKEQMAQDKNKEYILKRLD